MTVQIRHSVFETNSSSSHSLTISKTAIRQSELISKRAAEAGTIEVYLGEYGWEYRRYYTFIEKLQYLATQALNGVDSEDINTYTSASLDMLREVVKKLTGCDMVFQGSSFYIDHESVGVGGELYATAEKLEDFLTNEASYIETGNDNSNAPWIISSDKGPKHYLEEHYKDVPAGYQSCSFKVQSRQMSCIITNDGRVIAESVNEALFHKIVEQGILVKVVSVFHPDYSFYDSIDVRKVSGVGDVQNVVQIWDEKTRTAKASLRVSPKLDYTELKEKNLEDKWSSEIYCVIKLPAELIQEINEAPVLTKQEMELKVRESRVQSWLDQINEEMNEPSPDNTQIERIKGYILKEQEAIAALLASLQKE